MGIELKDIWKLTHSIVGLDFLYFDTAIEVKQTPHRDPVRIWGVTVNKNGSVWLMTSDQQWHQLETTDLNYNLVAASVYQRLKMYSKKQTA